MSNRARRIKRLFGLDLIVVDYIQLMTGSHGNKDGRVQEISQITQGLKAMAKELKSSSDSTLSTFKSSGTKR